MSNPLLRNSIFQSTIKTDEIMTVSGTINKSIFLWFLLIVSAIYSWMNPNIIVSFLSKILIGTFILVMVLVFKKSVSPFFSPLYAVCEGLILGMISLYFEKIYPGIVVNATLLTICALFCMLASYKAGMFMVTPRFKKVLTFSIFAIFLVYTIDFLLNVFGTEKILYIHNSSIFGIIISFIFVVVGSFSLIIDFDLIERGAQRGAPKYMEWYSSFSLMVTLVWIYLEMLRLILKLRD